MGVAETIIVCFFTFMLIGWPLLTYLGDAVRYVWWKVKGVGK